MSVWGWKGFFLQACPCEQLILLCEAGMSSIFNLFVFWGGTTLRNVLQGCSGRLPVTYSVMSLLTLWKACLLVFGKGKIWPEISSKAFSYSSAPVEALVGGILQQSITFFTKNMSITSLKLAKMTAWTWIPVYSINVDLKSVSFS